MIRAANIPALRGPGALAAPAGGVLVTGRQAGQRLARTELSTAIYHHQPPLTERPAHFLLTSLAWLYRATRGLPGGWWGFVALVVLAATMVTVALARIGPVARAPRRRAGPGPAAPDRTAGEHRDAPARLAEAGDCAGGDLRAGPGHRGGTRRARHSRAPDRADRGRVRRRGRPRPAAARGWPAERGAPAVAWGTPTGAARKGEPEHPSPANGAGGFVPPA